MTLSRPKAMTICIALLAGLAAGCGTTNAADSKSVAGTPIHIASDPPGADLYIMGKQVGSTPMTISDQDIYPLSYEVDTERFYGIVFLLKDGCNEYSRRLTRSDIKNGLMAELVCSTGNPAAASPPVETAAPATTTAPPATKTPVKAETPRSVESSTAGLVTASPPGDAREPEAQTQADRESLYERRLKQLKSLQELLDEGLISKEEEERLRRRIIDAL